MVDDGIHPRTRSIQYALQDVAVDNRTITTALDFPFGVISDWKPNITYEEIVIDGTHTHVPYDGYRGAFTGGFSVDFTPTNWRSLYMALGTSTGGGADDAWTHTMVPSTTLPYILGNGQSKQTKADQFIGSWCESWKLTATKGGVAKVSATFQSLEYDDTVDASTITLLTAAHASSQTTSNPDTDSLSATPFRFSDGTNGFDFQLNIAGGGLTAYNSWVHEIEFGINNTINRGPAWDEAWADYFTLDKQEFDFSVTIDLHDQTGQETFQEIVSLQQSVVAQLTFTRATGDDLVITLPNLKIHEFPKEYDTAIRVKLPFKVYYDETLGYSVQCVATDDIEDYKLVGTA